MDSKKQDLLARLQSLTREGRRPLSDFLQLSGEAGEEDLRAVRSFLFDLFCQIYDIDPGSDEGGRMRFRFLKELARGQSVEEVARLFIGNLYLAEHGGPTTLPTGQPATAPEPRKTPRSLAERARQVIEAQYIERISLQSIASELAVSKEHLSRIFKKKFGKTVTEFIHETRIGQARRLMADGDMSLKQVCYETGYQSYNDFYRNFRKVTGQSPKDFVESTGNDA